jgi:hypothetical protein
MPTTERNVNEGNEVKASEPIRMSNLVERGWMQPESNLSGRRTHRASVHSMPLKRLLACVRACLDYTKQYGH